MGPEPRRFSSMENKNAFYTHVKTLERVKFPYFIYIEEDVVPQ